MKSNNSVRYVFSILSFLSFLLISSGCVKDPELIQIEEINFLKQEGTMVLTDITALVKNPNKIGASIEKADAIILIDGQNVGSIKGDLDIKLKAGDTQKVNLKSRINLDVFSKLFPELMSKKSSLVEIQGDFFIASVLGSVKIKANSSKEMPLKNEIQKQIQQKLNNDAFAVQKVLPGSIGIGKSSWNMEMKIKNDFGIDYQLDSTDLKLYIGNETTPFGSWTLSDPIKVAAGSAELISATVNIYNLKMVRQMAFNLFGEKKIRIDGNCFIALDKYPFTIPIDQSITIF